ncbi:MAG: bifunctional DNA primase/polymerase [Candidatus Hydrogenedentota bacterium]
MISRQLPSANIEAERSPLAATPTAPSLLAEVTRADLLGEAWAARERGWHLVCQLPDGSTPKGIRWGEGPSPPWDEIKEWIHEHCRLAMHLGKSRLAVLDVDFQRGGKIPDGLPRTPIVSTPSGGWHVYFRHTHVEGDKQNTTIAPGVELKSGKALIPIVGSIKTVDGSVRGSYEWLVSPDAC